MQQKSRIRPAFMCAAIVLGILCTHLGTNSESRINLGTMLHLPSFLQKS